MLNNTNYSEGLKLYSGSKFNKHKKLRFYFGNKNHVTMFVEVIAKKAIYMDCLYNKYKILESSSFNPNPYLYSDISFLFVKYYPKFKNLFRYLFGYPESFSELLNSVEKYANEHNPKNILSFFDHENTDDPEYYDYVLENYSYCRIRCYLNGVMEEKISGSYFFMILSFILCPKRIIENLIKYIKSEFAELKSIGL